MRKILSFCLLILSFTSLTVYGAETTINIDKATLNDTAVAFEYSVENPVENQQITIMALGYENDAFNYENIVYINQIDYVEGASVNFEYGAWADPEGVYALKIGGTNIDTPDWMVLDMATKTVIYGDVDENGLIDAGDSALTLQHVLNPTSVNLSETQLMAARVNGTEEITAYEAACILSKVLDSDFVFVVEEL